MKSILVTPYNAVGENKLIKDVDVMVTATSKVEQARQFLESIGEDPSEYSESYLAKMLDEGF